MTYDEISLNIIQEEGVEQSTMMKTPCLRYKGSFMTMMFEKEASLIIKVSPERVNEIMAAGNGNEFNFTKKRFKEWVLIPIEFEEKFESFIYESLEYAKKTV